MTVSNAFGNAPRGPICRVAPNPAWLGTRRDDRKVGGHRVGWFIDASSCRAVCDPGKRCPFQIVAQCDAGKTQAIQHRDRKEEYHHHGQNQLLSIAQLQAHAPSFHIPPIRAVSFPSRRTPRVVVVVSVGVIEAVGVTVTVGERVAVGVMVAVSVGVSVNVGVSVGVDVSVAVLVGVGVWVPVGVAVLVAVGLGVGV
jgi:hypothetical protein